MSKYVNKDFRTAVIAGLNDASLSLVRSLGRKGVHIIGLYDEDSHAYYIKSKYCSVKLRASLYGEALIDTLINKVAKNLEKSPVLFCTNDNAVLSVSKYQDELKPFFKFVVPSYEVASTQISKKGFHKFALDHSFSVPKTFFANEIGEIEENIEKITFPCIMKPEFRDRIWSGKVPVKVLYVESKENLMHLIKQYSLQKTSLVMQEWIDGDDTEVYFCLTYINRNHDPLAVCAGRKLWQHPHLTGSTSIAETVWIPEVADESLRLLKTAGCIGFCSVEFKRSKRNGRFYVTEPTVGRPDTQEGVCLSAGLDIAYVAYLDALGEHVKPLRDYERGVKWINEPLAFYGLKEFMGGKRKIGDFLKIYKGARSYSLWTYDDPGPAFTFYKEKIEKGFSRLLTRVS